MIRPLHPEARCARTIQEGDQIVPIQYGPDRKPTDKVQFAAFDTVEIMSIDMHLRNVKVRNDFGLVRTMSFKDLGLPRFTIPRFKLGLWRRRVCTVPKDVALDLMRQYINEHREPINRGPGWGPFDEIAISENKLGTQVPSVRSPWDVDIKVAS